MNIKLKILLCSALVVLSGSLTASADQEAEGRRLAKLAFSSLDSAGRGFIDMGEFSGFGDDVFVSMDADEDSKLSLSEFLAWDFGMLPLAQEAGREDAYYTALRVVFAFRDRNGDNLVSQTEQRKSLNADFQRADTDGDAVLTEAEFTSGFSVMVALRAAITQRQPNKITKCKGADYAKKTGCFYNCGLIAVFAVIHLVFAPEHHDPRTTGTVMLGGIAFLLMTCSILLSTRLDVFEGCFGGLDRMYQVHRVAGVFAAITALVHFFSVPKELPEGVDPVLNSIFPSGPLGMLGLIFLVIGLFVALNRKIRYSLWRPTHKIMGLVYVLIIGHFMTAPGIFFERFSASGFILIVAAAVGVVALIYSVFGMNKRTAVPFTIEAVNALERATEVVLKPEGKMLDFKPGQFAFIEIEGKEWHEPHPFTISSAPGEDRLRFTVKVLGDWTRKVREELQACGRVQVRGPYGRFDATEGGKKQIWLAGGIGLTPFLSKLRAMEKGDDRQIHLVYAAREAQEAIFLDELKDRAAELGNVTLVPLFSEEGNFARVDMMKQKLPDPLETYDYYMCGPKPMVDGITKGLRTEGVGRANIHTEAFEFR